jgi:hypothetical protein
LGELTTGGPPESTIEFVLPRGFTGSDGRVHRKGVIRLATQQDLIAVESERGDSAGIAYAWTLLLSRILTSLGDLPLDRMDCYELVLAMWAGDVAYLQSVYESLDRRASNFGPPKCPHCGAGIDLIALLSQRPDLG